MMGSGMMWMMWFGRLRLYNELRVLPGLRQPRQCGHNLICPPSPISRAWCIAGYQGAIRLDPFRHAYAVPASS